MLVVNRDFDVCKFLRDMIRAAIVMLVLGVIVMSVAFGVIDMCILGDNRDVLLGIVCMFSVLAAAGVAWVLLVAAAMLAYKKSARVRWYAWRYCDVVQEGGEVEGEGEGDETQKITDGVKAGEEGAREKRTP